MNLEDDIKNEINIIRLFDHPNVDNIKDVFETDD